MFYFLTGYVSPPVCLQSFWGESAAVKYNDLTTWACFAWNTFYIRNVEINLSYFAFCFSHPCGRVRRKKKQSPPNSALIPNIKERHHITSTHPVCKQFPVCVSGLRGCVSWRHLWLVTQETRWFWGVEPKHRWRKTAFEDINMWRSPCHVKSASLSTAALSTKQGYRALHRESLAAQRHAVLLK